MRISDWSSDVCSSDLFGAGAVMARFDWYPVLNACLVILAALIILVLPLADGLVPGAIHGWGDAPAAAFLFPLIGVVLAPVYPTIISVMLSAMPHRQHPPLDRKSTRLNSSH